MSISELKGKLALGTVQLGLPYGINNKTGKPSQANSFEIISTAIQNGIFTIDTAEAYGDSLAVIGAYLKTQAKANLKIISKFTDGGNPLRERVTNSLKILNAPHLYAYLYHRFSDYQNPSIKSYLIELKNEGLIQKIGISLYDLSQLEMVLDDPTISLIQIPLNPLDNPGKKKSLLVQAKLNGIEVHVRSVFLQGLFFKNENELTGNLTDLSNTLSDFKKCVVKYDLSVRQACLNYALHQPYVDFVVIGVENSLQLGQNIDSILNEFSTEIMRDLESINVTNPSLLNPGNWKP